jgi:Flp pilus assembly pilin Flp
MIKLLGKRENGQGLVEYALILLFVAIAVVASITAFGGALSAYYQTIVAAV